MALATLSIDLVAQLANLQSGMDKAGRIADQRAAKMAKSFESVRLAAIGIGAALGTALSAAGLVSLFRAANDGVAKLKELKDATGASIENLSALEDIATRTGTSMDTAGKAVIKINQALNAAKPGSNQAQALEALGLSVENLRKLDPAEALRQVSVAMNQFAEDGEKARAAQFLFGEEIKIIAPLLKNLGVQGEYVAKVTTEQALAAEAFNNQLASMQKNVTDVAREISGPLVKALNTLFERAKGEGWLASLFTPTEVQRSIAKAQELSLAITNVGNALMRAEALSKQTSLPGVVRAKWASDAKALRARLEELQRQAFATSAALKGVGLDSKAGAGRGFVNPKPVLVLPKTPGANPPSGTGRANPADRLRPPPSGEMGPFLPEPEPPSAAMLAALREIQNTDLAKIGRINDTLDQLFLLRATTAGNEAQLDQAIENLRTELEKLGPAAEEAAAEVVPALAEIDEFAQQAARNIQDALGDTLQSALAGNFDSIEDLWKNMLTRMVAEAAAAQINKALFGAGGVGSGGGALGSAADFLDFMLNGFSVSPRAKGGPVSAGVPYLVGERGPEIVVPRQAGTVLPNGQRLGGGPVFTVNVQGDASENTLRLINGALAQFEARMLMRGAA